MRSIYFSSVAFFVFATALNPTIPCQELPALYAKSSTHSFLKASTREKIKNYIETKEYHRLGFMLRQAIGHTLSMQEVKKIAQKAKCKPLLAAIGATDSTLALEHNLGLSAAELLQAALYVETEFTNKINQNKHYLSVEETGLSCALQFDPATKARYIHPHTNELTRLGAGVHKVVTKSIRYSRKSPEVVARCKQTKLLEAELERTKALQDVPGVVKLEGSTTHTENNTTYHTLFCKLYNAGTLSRILKNPDMKFTLKEKLQMASGILKGLEGMQSKNIIHRDLCLQNCLVNISKKKEKSTRKIDAVISDFGCSKYLTEATQIRVQGHSEYTSPEGVYVSKMQGRDYFQSDLFAVGSLLYHILYEKKPQWVTQEHVKGPGTEDERYQKHVAIIQNTTAQQKQELAKKKAEGHALSVKDQFEEIVLSMCDPDPAKRGTAASQRQNVDALISLLDKK